jgi:HEPN domain-containing protein
MADAERDAAQKWLLKALHDLESARKLVAGDDPILDTAIYHCQQAAEKAVKGFLTFHRKRFEKTHDIERLILLATQLN